MYIHVSNNQNILTFSFDLVKSIANQVVCGEGQTCEELSIHFVDIPTIQELHQQFFGDPSATDCISLPMDEDPNEPYRVLGEIFVCPEVALEYAKSHHLDPYEETTLYIIHGLLHLLGYDDIEEPQEKEMRQAEAKYMARVKSLDLILKPI